MEKFDEEIVFLDSEILDDDDDAPVGELVMHENTAVAAEPEAAADTVVAEETAPEVAPEDVPPVAEEVAETPAEDTPVEEAPAEDIQTAESVEEPVAEEAPVEESVAAAEVAPEESAPEAVQDDAVAEDSSVFDAPTAQEEVSSPVEEKVEEPVAPKKKVPAKVGKKPAEDKDIWGVAAINVKKEETHKDTEEEKKVAKDTKKPVAAAKAEPAKKEAPKAAVKEEKAPKADSTKKAAPAKAEKAPVEKPAKTAAKAAPVKEEKAPAKAETAKKAAPAKEEKAPVKAEPAKAAAAKKEEPAAEKIIVEGEGKIHGKFVIKKTVNGNFVFKLYSSNHRVIAIGAQPYKDQKSCMGGINSVKNNAEKAPIENQTLKKFDVEKCPKWELYLDKKGEARLRLIASNGNIVATTNDGYVDIGGAKKGIAAIARACVGCAVVRNDTLW